MKNKKLIKLNKNIYSESVKNSLFIAKIFYNKPKIIIASLGIILVLLSIIFVPTFKFKRFGVVGTILLLLLPINIEKDPIKITATFFIMTLLIFIGAMVPLGIASGSTNIYQHTIINNFEYADAVNEISKTKTIYNTSSDKNIALRFL